MLRRVLILTIVVVAVAMPALARSSQAPGGWVYFGAYARSPQGLNLELFRVRGDGAVRQRLTRNGSSDFWADVSPNGARIAFVRYMSGNVHGFTSLWVMNADGTGLRQLVGPRDLPAEWPRWSPDGRWIAFQSQCGFGSTGGADDTCVELSVIRPDGSGERRLARSLFEGGSRSSFGNGSAWSWSPDSRAIALERRRDSESDAAVVALVDVATGEQRVLSSGYGPAFAPHRPLLALSRGRRIAVVSTSGAQVRLLPAPPPEWSDSAPSWSPDGSRVAFWRERSDGEGFQGVVVGPRTRTRSFTVERPVVRPLSWSPEGTHLVASTRPGEAASIHRLDVRSGARERLGPGFAEDWARSPR